MNKQTFLTLAIVSALTAFAIAQDSKKPADHSVGGAAVPQQLAPGFSLTDLAGRKLDLDTFRGQVVLLNFWATWCAPCRAEIPEFVDLQSKYRDLGLQVIGISLDDEVQPVRAFIRQIKMNYRIALGDAGLAERYGGILGLPVSFLIGCDGRIYARHSGRADTTQIERELKPLLKAVSCTGGKATEHKPSDQR